MPTSKGKQRYFSPEENERVQQVLKEKGHYGPCRHCGAQEWLLNDGPAWIRLGSFNALERGHGHAHLVCHRCGEVKLISLWAVGLEDVSEMFAELDVPVTRGSEKDGA